MCKPNYYPNPDSQLRLRQRRYQAAPHDPEAAGSYIASLERTGSASSDIAVIEKCEKRFLAAFKACEKACDQALGGSGFPDS
jgi:hypothetical protein